MTNTKNYDVALFRYNLILPVLQDDFPDVSIHQYFLRIASEERSFPNGKFGIVQPGTLRSWLCAYRKHGLDGLLPQPRRDAGGFRALSKKQQNLILTYKQQNPRRTAVSIYRQLIKDGDAYVNEVSIASVQRFIARMKPSLQQATVEDMRAFEMEFANDLWQIDTSHGPYLTIDNKKVKTYMIMIIDDASRFLVGFGIFLADTAVHVQTVLKNAIAKYGIPKRLYTDNGGPYRNQQLELICATLGIGLKHAQPYHGNQKGKIERNFKSVKEAWMYDLDYSQFTTTQQLEESLAVYVDEKNRSAHRSLPHDKCPWSRFLQDKERFRRIHEIQLERAFLHTVTRKVANDATIQLHTKVFETSQNYIGQRIEIKYMYDLSVVYLVDKEQYLVLQEVDKQANANIKRKQPLLSTEKE